MMRPPPRPAHPAGRRSPRTLACRWTPLAARRPASVAQCVAPCQPSAHDRRACEPRSWWHRPPPQPRTGRQGVRLPGTVVRGRRARRALRGVDCVGRTRRRHRPQVCAGMGAAASQFWWYLVAQTQQFFPPSKRPLKPIWLSCRLLTRAHTYAHTFHTRAHTHTHTHMHTHTHTHTRACTHSAGASTCVSPMSHWPPEASPSASSPHCTRWAPHPRPRMRGLSCLPWSLQQQAQSGGL
jgi:hypothetical protein